MGWGGLRVAASDGGEMFGDVVDNPMPLATGPPALQPQFQQPLTFLNS
jgi:hypothetical protein